MPDRKFSGKIEVIAALLALVALIAVAFYMRTPHTAAPDSATAHISLDGTEVLTIDLVAAQNQRIDLMEAYGIPVSFEVENHGIRFVDVTCPDHICEKTGSVSRDGQTAVCMPNRVAVTVTE